MSFICECKKVCKSITGLNLHRKKCKGIPIILDFQCEQCQRYFKSSNGLGLHKKICGVESEGHPCKCGKICKSEGGLIVHQKSCDGTPFKKKTIEEGPTTCDTCGKKCKSQNGLKLHLITCMSTETFNCETCGKSCKTKNGLALHKKKCNVEGLEQTCTFCNKVCKTEIGMLIHLKCCKKATPSTPPNSEDEISMSEDEREETEFQCEYCNQILSPEDYHSHVKTCLNKSLAKLKTRSKKKPT
jgi:hypothetical protein